MEFKYSTTNGIEIAKRISPDNVKERTKTFKSNTKINVDVLDR